MSRLNTVMGKLVSLEGRLVSQDFVGLEAFNNVIANNIHMVALISRASRSYSIGLKNADIEVDWVNVICTRLARSSLFSLELLQDYFGIVRMNPSLLNSGRFVLESGAYPIESPLQKNW